MAAPLPIASLYVSLLASVFLYLTFAVIGLRRSGKVPSGDGGNKALARRIRVSAMLLQQACDSWRNADPLAMYRRPIAPLQTTQPQGHANFSELVPFVLLLLVLVEVRAAASGLVLHAIGAALLAGRAAHAAAFTNDRLPAALHFRARTFGTAATTGCMGVLAALLLKSALL
jgi:uncharacterized membrane protein YecN with MAPEG domain